MKQPRWVAVLALFAMTMSPAKLASAASDGPGDWIPVRSEEGRFRAEFPHEPEVTTSSRMSWLGRVTIGFAELTLDDATFGVTFHDLPTLAKLLDAQWILERVERELIESLDASLEHGEETTYQDYPARLVRYAFPSREGWREEALLVLVGRRLYIVSASGHRPDWQRDASRFFAAFALWPGEDEN